MEKTERTNDFKNECMQAMTKRLRLKVIACAVLHRYIAKYVYESQHRLDVNFFKIKKHIKPEELQREIQAEIDATNAEDYDYILLGYGLCGNAILGVHSNDVPIVIPRAHDCCTFFMGSREAFVQEFGENYSAEWCSDGYFERSCGIHAGDLDGGGTDTLGIGKSYEEFVEEYGEENAAFLFETLNPKKDNDEIVYIKTPETAHLGYEAEVKALAAEEGVKLKEVEGTTQIIEKLCFGEWDEDFLILKPRMRVSSVYDSVRIIDAEAIE